jgi:hypothetical protein
VAAKRISVIAAVAVVAAGRIPPATTTTTRGEKYICVCVFIISEPGAPSRSTPIAFSHLPTYLHCTVCMYVCMYVHTCQSSRGRKEGRKETSGGRGGEQGFLLGE